MTRHVCEAARRSGGVRIGQALQGRERAPQDDGAAAAEARHRWPVHRARLLLLALLLRSAAARIDGGQQLLRALDDAPEARRVRGIAVVEVGQLRLEALHRMLEGTPDECAAGETGEQAARHLHMAYAREDVALLVVQPAVQLRLVCAGRALQARLGKVRLRDEDERLDADKELQQAALGWVPRLAALLAGPGPEQLPRTSAQRSERMTAIRTLRQTLPS